MTQLQTLLDRQLAERQPNAQPESEPHLDDQQLAELVSGEPAEPIAIAHLEGCASCRAVLAELTADLELLRDDLRARVDGAPAAFWAAQRTAIASRRATRSADSWAGWRLVLVAALLCAVVGGAFWPGRPAVLSPATDEALLRDVEHALTRQAPESLAPAESLLRALTVAASHEEPAAADAHDVPSAPAPRAPGTGGSA